MLRRFQLGSRRTTTSLQERMGFPFQTNTWRMERHAKEWFRLLESGVSKSRSKNVRYLATIQNGNTAEWDCSCLFFAILFSDNIGTTLSAVIKKDVNSLRQVRNDIAHISEAKLTDTEFMGYVGRVLLAFNSLCLPISDIEAVKNQTNFPTAEVKNLRYQCTPNLTIFQKKCFSLFQIDLIAIFHLKKFYEKRLILSKVINEKRFFPLIISNG